MGELKPMFSCDLCGSKFRMGGGQYEGHVLSHYNMSLCGPCYAGNWDGFAPHYEPILERHLAANGITLPQRNSKGWYPR